MFRQVAAALRAAIHERRLRPGDRAPSTRALARALGVSRNIVLLAYADLAAEGYFEGRSGSGTYVASTPPPARPSPIARSGGAPGSTPLSGYGARVSRIAAHLNSADPASSVEIDFRYWETGLDAKSAVEWAQIARRRLSRRSAAYSDPAGRLSLRQSIAAKIAATRGVNATADDVVVLGGSQQALDIVSRLTLDPGDRAVIEDPCYQGVRHAIAAAGADAVPSPVGAEGLIIPPAMSAARVKLVVVTPTRQFPAGVSMPYARRTALLEWCEAAGAFALEDDYDGEYQHDEHPFVALKGMDASGRVIYAGTFSRALTPSLRIGFVIAPPALRDAIVSAKWLSDRGEPEFEQSVLAEFIDSGCYERHVRRMSRTYGARRRELARALNEEFGDDLVVEGALAGSHVMARLPRLGFGSVDELAARARAAGVGVYSPARYYVAPPRECALLLGFAATPIESIAAGAKRLRRAYDRMRGVEPRP